MLVKPNWDIFKAKFSENPQENFEWFCYLLFSKEYNQPYGIHRYKNQSGIETDPIEVGDEVIGWQSKFYEDTLSNHKEDLLGTLTKTKRDNPNITKIILYTNSEWGQGQGTKEPKAKIETEKKADELNIELVWMVQSNFEIYCQEERNINISRYFFELDSKWELSNYGFIETLKLKYQNEFKTISLLLDKPKHIDDIFINLAIIKEKKSEKNKENFINREALLSSYEEIQKPKEPIEIKDLIQKSSKSLIYGKAGVGKTTLCKYITYKWAKGELYNEFEYVVYIPLREWKNDGIKGAIQDYYYSRDSDKLTIDIASSKMLFLFDGYDELDSDRKKLLRDEIDKYVLTHYIITTRPYGYQKSDFRVDEHFETIGFTDENVDSYINNFFDEENQKSQSLKSYLQSNISIKHIAYIPLMLEMICSLWDKEEFTDSLTMTELYSKVIEDMLNKYSASKDDERVFKRKNRKQIKAYLGKIAFEGLIKQKILFDGDLIEDAVEDIDFFEENVIYSGFLKSDVKEKDLLDNHFEFPHLTFQEYFAALYVSKLSKEEQSEIIRDWKFYPHMQMFFVFLGGEIKDKEFFLDKVKVLSKKNDIVIYHGTYIFMLILNCLQNIKKDELSIEKIEIIENDILREFDRTLDYPDFLEKLKLVSGFISDIIVTDFTEMAISDYYSIEFRKDLIIYLFSVGRYEERIISTFLEIIEHPELTEDLLLFNKNKFIDELIDSGSNELKNIEIGFRKIKKNKDFENSIKIIENLFKKYVNHKDVIISSSMNWLELMIEDDENSMLREIEYEYNNDRHKSFFSLLVNNLINTSSFLDSYVALLNENIERERKLFIAMFLYFMNKISSEVISILIDNPLDTFNNCEFGLIKFIKKDIDRGTNIFNTFESSLKEKKISLSFENSHKMLKEMIRDICSVGTEELDEKLLNFITEYYIENENIDLQHRKDIIKPSKFYLIKDSNKTIQKIFQEDHPQYLDNQEQNIKIEDDISQEKNIFVWDIEKVIKERWNLDDFLKSIRYSIVHKKKIIELVAEFEFTEKNIKTLTELMFNEDIKFHFTEENIKTFIALMSDESIELKVRRDMTKALYENDVDNDKVLQQLTEYINETDLKFIVKANPEIEPSSNLKVINALVEKLNRYYDKEEWLGHYFKEYNLHAFLNNEKVVDILFRIVRSTSISSHDKKDLLPYCCGEYSHIPNDKVVDMLIGFISDREKFFHNFEYWISRYDWEVVDILIRPLESISSSEAYSMLKFLISNGDKVPNMKDDIYYTWRNIILLLARSPNPNTFLEDEDIPKEAKKIFSRSCSTENLFLSYKTEYEYMASYIEYHLHYKNLPLYIKNDKKFYTVLNGKEISTEEINQNYLDNNTAIKEAFRKKFLNNDSNTPLDTEIFIVTEGKTDWKHLKKALNRFQGKGIYLNLNIKFDEYENRGAGEAYLDNQLKSYASHKQERKIIGIFDRDTKVYVRDYGKQEFVKILDKDYKNRLKEKIEKYYSDKSSPKYKSFEQNLESGNYSEIEEDIKKALTGDDYNEWKKLSENNVYAFCIPEIQDSDSPRELDAICIEFYYKEKDLKTTTKDGKRLFFADEFKVNQEHRDKSERFISKCGKFKTESVKVKEGAKKELTLISTPVYNDENKDILLSKNDFTNHIINDVEGFKYFEIENFKLIFDVIEKIIYDV